MPASGKTSNYQIPIYNPGDTANYLTSYNQGMTIIDTQMKANATAAEQAQDGVNNLESEYESVVQTLSTHTSQIDNNQKAIAANTASIEELENEFNNIAIFDAKVFKSLTDEGVTKIESLVQAGAIKGRRIGNNFSGICSVIMTEGTLHSYDRQGNIGNDANQYITDLFRISGNPFNLIKNKWEWLVGGAIRDTASSITAQFCIGYLEDSGFTVVGVASSASSAIPSNNQAVVVI